METQFMPALTIKNIPEDLYNELKLVAEQHHRSINSEVIVCLKRTLLPKKISPEVGRSMPLSMENKTDFPTPLSPVIKTVEPTGLTLSALSNTLIIEGLRAII